LLIPGASAPQQKKGIWYRVQHGDTLWDLAKKYRVPLVHLAKSNRLSSPKTLQIGTRLFIPGAQSTEFTAPLLIPLAVTSGFGYRHHPISKELKFHRGVDLRARVKTRVYATKAGKVTRAGWSGGYGNVIVIEHDHGYTTWYGHLSSVWVKVGQEIKQSDAIGLSGRSGHATGPHLHFEIRRNGKSVDPARYIGLP
jgi:murein DD-endopeptidase MepM/ murein hydrolase activator NlpD